MLNPSQTVRERHSEGPHQTSFPETRAPHQGSTHLHKGSKYIFTHGVSRS